MSWKEFIRRPWVKFGFWAVLYTSWVVWLGNFWWLLGLVIVFDLCVSKKVNWLFWQKHYKEGEKRNALLDWLDAIIFAVVVVTFINIFFFQAFKIPSSSMESTLYTGDHLFVSKLAYGPKVPQTPLTIPFTHNVILGKESYSTLINNDYRRLKGFGSVERGDKVVFNFPHGDSVLRRAPSEDYYALQRILGREETIRRFGPVISRPMDKKDHYVKRCVALPGDTLEVVNGLVRVNSRMEPEYEGMQLTYRVVTSGARINSRIIEKLGFNLSELSFDPSLPGYPSMALTKAKLEQIKNLSSVKSVELNLETEPDGFYGTFPFSSEYRWTRDFYGPLWVPQKGATVTLDSHNLPLYSRIITAYEGNELEVKNGEIFINGEIAHEYTFRQDYYFMMGDNRHNSLDSRYWGFVPENHIVGKPVVIWLSTDRDRKFPHNIRWGRFCKFV